MTESQNPYQPPADSKREPSWWSHIKAIFSVRGRYHSLRFARGTAIIFEGIAYFIDPDANFLYAASPSSDTSDSRMELIIGESRRLLPIFLTEFPSLIPIVDGRRLCVRMIGAYSDSQSEYVRQVKLDVIDLRPECAAGLN